MLANAFPRSLPAVTAPQQVGVPDQRGCLACGQRRWPGNHPLCWSLGMRSALGMASQQRQAGFCADVQEASCADGPGTPALAAGG